MSQQHQRTLYSLDGNFDVEAELQEKLGGNTPQPPQPSWPRLQKRKAITVRPNGLWRPTRDLGLEFTTLMFLGQNSNMCHLLDLVLNSLLVMAFQIIFGTEIRGSK